MDPLPCAEEPTVRRRCLAFESGCSACGSTTPVMHTLLALDAEVLLCDVCCPESVRRSAVGQDVIDILSQE